MSCSLSFCYFHPLAYVLLCLWVKDEVTRGAAMAQAIPKRDWLEVEEVLARSAYLEFLVERWLWEVPLSLAASTGQADRPDAELPLGQRAIQSLQSFGWFQEPASTVSH